jgi:hypothetical protein
MATLPTYDGSNTLGYPIHDFFEELETYFEAKATPAARKPTLLDKLIQGIAKQEYDAALADNTIVQPDYVGDAAAIQVVAETQYNNHKNWLITRFHGETEQEAMKTTIENMVQSINKSPRQWHGRVTLAVGKSGYHENILAHVIHSTWLKGLHPEIKQHIRIMPPAENSVKVTTAENYWNAYHTAEVEPPITKYKPTP